MTPDDDRGAREDGFLGGLGGPSEVETVDPHHEDAGHGGLLGGFGGHHHHQRRRRRGGLASCLVLVVVAALVLAAIVVGVTVGRDRLSDVMAPPPDYSGEGRGKVVFEVKSGEGTSEIGHNLEDAGVVKSVEAFTEAAADDPDALSIQVGFYELERELPAEAALDVLVDPDNLVQETVTVPEGLRVEDVLKTLAEGTDFPVAKFEAAVDSDSIGLPSYAEGNPEGYLFPATYAVPPNADAVDVLSMMVDRWAQAAEEAGLEEAAKGSDYDAGELMTIASLVESEVNRAEDRGKVARVIYNRLESNATDGLLQIDATVNYALGRDLGLGLTEEDLQVDSPYNTRKNPGLPPGPIESPGDDAISAATDPPEGDWIYYVTVNLDTGETLFTDDYDQFLEWKNNDLAQYCESSDRC